MEFEKVRDIIVETLGCDAEKVTPEATLAEDLGADSPGLCGAGDGAGGGLRHQHRRRRCGRPQDRGRHPGLPGGPQGLMSQAGRRGKLSFPPVPFVPGNRLFGKELT